ncbi:gamma-glutamyl-gamma-aminobutyrate hydrolase family protein [Notoacmeibacter sp. MSK16QG-6]|uniref:gamma-glutamyl-gamma-aminobutyrate hydrolase family protein n=1 Tax=Notoacmeibacter sp. MSK16QG-6 TaxID=2957982 RepID=UPI00209F205E|nr:gamma-glutamyl-gamma-aminobutyrate hydrolase family protein [Notoacmeibacter sp. MSK16QG-6]MCP1200326.1 gamma-glutamyl-gamma-aminobutyrate hydrolase family protein [Notoacmeibacter sp. MSK16QG-6]
MTSPLIAIVADTLVHESYVWHATPDTYLKAVVEVARLQPLIVPAFGRKTNYDAVLAAVDGVMLTGARSNVHPDNYGVAATENHGPFDPARDATSLPLIQMALERGLPLLAICRGHQELNVALGGTIADEVQELPGRADHRAPEADTQDERYIIRQNVAVRPDGPLTGMLGGQTIAVNSLHRQAIDRPADRLSVEATASDGTAEAVCVKDATAFAYGFQWHPEYWASTDEPSRAIFEAFGKAVRDHAASA